MRIQRLEAAHAAAYRELILHAYVEAADAFTSTAGERAAEAEAFWVRRIADPRGLGLGIGAFDEAGRLVGSVALEFSAKPKTRHQALLIGMYVHPEARGRGLGAALVQAALDEAARHGGIRVLMLTVTAGNGPAVRLYERHGFRRFGVEPLAIATPAGFKAKLHMARVLPGDAAVDAGGAVPAATMHVFCGKAGAGKSTLAARIAAQTGALLIAEDVWMMRLYGERMQTFDDYKAFAPKLKSVIGPLATDLLARGHDVVLDFQANTRALRAWFLALATQAGAGLRLHWIDVPDAVCLERIARRNVERPAGSHELSEADFALVTSYFEPPAPDEGLEIELHRT